MSSCVSSCHASARVAGTSVSVLLTLFGLWAILNWFRSPIPQSVVERIPVADGSSDAAPVELAAATNLEGTFMMTSDAPVEPLPGAWPSFRGTHHDNVARDGAPLLEYFPESGPPVLWTLPLGEGYAAAVVRDGRVYILDYDEEAQADAMRCIGLADGRERWRHSYEVRVKRNHGMSRTVPALSRDAVISFGPKCHVLCLDALTGTFRWVMDLVADYGAEVPLWYAGQCPLVDGDTVVLAPGGGDALLMGVNVNSGEVMWRTPNPNQWKMSHASVMPMTLAGRRMYIYPAIGGMVGVSAEGADIGRVLWETQEWTASVVAPSPVPIGSDRVFVTAGYGSGSAIFQVRDSNGAYVAEKVLTLEKTQFACEQHTPIYYADHLYTVMPSDAGALRRQLVCANRDGDIVWTSGQTDRFGLGPFLVADDKLWVLDDDGNLSLVRASSPSYTRLARAKVLDGVESWAPMVLVGTRLLLRDSKTMVCLNVAADANRGAQ